MWGFGWSWRLLLAPQFWFLAKVHLSLQLCLLSFLLHLLYLAEQVQYFPAVVVMLFMLLCTPFCFLLFGVGVSSSSFLVSTSVLVFGSRSISCPPPTTYSLIHLGLTPHGVPSPVLILFACRLSCLDSYFLYFFLFFLISLILFQVTLLCSMQSPKSTKVSR